MRAPILSGYDLQIIHLNPSNDCPQYLLLVAVPSKKKECVRLKSTLRGRVGAVVITG